MAFGGARSVITRHDDGRAVMAETVADQLAKARADLDKATTAAKLATAKRARLAAEVRALTAEAEIEAMRIQACADRERAEAAEARAEAAEATLERERAAHLEEERAHAAEVDQLKRGAAQKRPARAANGREPKVAAALVAMQPGDEPQTPEPSPGAT